MKRVSTTEFKERVGEFVDQPDIETTIIGPDDEPHWALISYEVYLQLRRDNREVMPIADLPEEIRREIERKTESR